MEIVKLFKGFPMMILINVVENMFNNHIQTRPAVIRKILGETHLILTNLGLFDIKQTNRLGEGERTPLLLILKQLSPGYEPLHECGTR